MILTGSDWRAGIGTHAGWALTFHDESGPELASEVMDAVTSDRYDGSVEATLPGGLEGGTYTVTVEGLLDAEHLKLAGRDPRSTVMRLHLFWYDTRGGKGYFANLASVTGLAGGPLAKQLADRLVAELTVVKVAREAGTRRYETVITARERVHERLSSEVRLSVCTDGPKRAVEVAAERAGVSVQFHEGFDAKGALPASKSSELGTAMTTLTRGQTWCKEVGEVATALEKATGRHGRGVLLIRDGVLHVGVRSGSPDGGEPLDLTPSVGLVDVGGATTRKGPKVGRTLTLKGRPDLKPGGVVRFDLPPTESAPKVGKAVGAAVAGSLGAVGPVLPRLTDKISNPQLLYVESVVHRLGRASGFVTTVTGVEVAKPGGAAELYDPPSAAGTDADRKERSSADSAERAGLAVRRGVRDALAALRFVDAGEVRAATAEGAGDAEGPPGRTTTVWRGLVDPDGHPNRLARLPVRRAEPDVRERIPHLSPFAWGRTGLVVPRYPGMRVVLAHGRGEADDPVDIGAVWETGKGPDARPGDWWLILPVGVAELARASLPDTSSAESHTGPVTQDLIDADGNRVIEVGELTVRITRDTLLPAGIRPERASEATDGDVPAGAICIEHVDAGSSIVMTPDGTVKITAKRIEFDGGDGEISLNAKTVDVNAETVNVKVTKAMDVSKKP